MKTSFTVPLTNNKSCSLEHLQPETRRQELLLPLPSPISWLKVLCLKPIVIGTLVLIMMNISYSFAGSPNSKLHLTIPFEVTNGVKLDYDHAKMGIDYGRAKMTMNPFKTWIPRIDIYHNKTFILLNSFLGDKTYGGIGDPACIDFGRFTISPLKKHHQEKPSLKKNCGWLGKHKMPAPSSEK